VVALGEVILGDQRALGMTAAPPTNEMRRAVIAKNVVNCMAIELVERR
jgi:hypothetical protein